MIHFSFLARKARNDVNVKRKSAMEIRLKKVRDRKRLKLGLPILEDDDESCKQLPDELDVCKTKETSVEDTVMESLKKLREEQSSKINDKDYKRKTTVREWDVGKEGVEEIMHSAKSNYIQKAKYDIGNEKAIETPVLSQSEWVSEQRQHRNNDFAPPSIYDKIVKPPKNYDDSKNVSKEATWRKSDFKPNKTSKFLNPRQHNVRTQVNDMKVFDNGLPQWNPELKPETNVNRNSSNTLDSPKNSIFGNPELKAKMKELEELIHPVTKTSYEINSDIKPSNQNDLQNSHCQSTTPESSNVQSTLSFEKRRKLHHEMMNNYGGTSTLGKRNHPSSTHSRSNLSNIHTDMSHLGEDHYERNKGVEIEPPPSMEYFSSQSNYSNNRYRKDNKSSVDSMKESMKIGMAKNALNSMPKNNVGTSSLIESDSD